MFIVIVTFLVILSILVLVHEAGHFFVARRFGVKCDEFGLGFPPRMIGLVKKNHCPNNAKNGLFANYKIIAGKDKSDEKEIQYENTIYSLNWIPLGGFVKIKGEQGENQNDHDSFSHKKIWQRALILSSGVTMNFVLAVVIFFIGFTVGTPQVLDSVITGQAKVRDEKIQILSVEKNSPAEKAGLETGDIVLSINNEKFSNIIHLQDYIKNNSSQSLEILTKRGDKQIKFQVQPEKMTFPGEAPKTAIGVSLAETGIVSYPAPRALIESLSTTTYLIRFIVLAFFDLFRGLIIAHKVTVDVSGPVGMAVVTGQVVKMGFIYIMQFTALLSINLGIINFFPFPALDGGRVIALGVEAVRRKPNNQKVEALIHNVGFGILMLMVVLITYRDIVKFSGDFFINLIR